MSNGYCGNINQQSEESAIQYSKGYQDGFLEAKNLDSITNPEKRLKGKWENITKPGDFTPGGDPIGRCPFCKDVHSIHDIGIEGPHWNFCPMCGAELK